MTDDRMERDGVRPDQHRRRRRRKRPARTPSRGPAVAAGAILIVWAASNVVDMLSTQYSPPEGMNTVALAAVTYFVGTALRKENQDDS